MNGGAQGWGGGCAVGTGLGGVGVGVGTLAGSQGLAAMPIMANCSKGGSGRAPCRVLSSLCASSWLHNGLRKLNRGQVIGLEIDNNKAGPRPVSDAPPAATFEVTRETVKPMGKPKPEPTYHSAAPPLCPVPGGGRSCHTAGE